MVESAPEPPEETKASTEPLAPSSIEIEQRLEGMWRGAGNPDADYFDIRLGSQAGHYILESFIGSGAFGIVYKAKHIHHGQPAAVKFPRPELLANPDAIQRFSSEAAASMRLNHSSIVPIYEADLSAAAPYIVSEYCDGPDLAEWLWLSSDRVTEDRDILSFALQLVPGIEYAHENGIIHRDIKPSNILLIRHPDKHASESLKLVDFTPKLTDFGLAKLTTESITTSRSSLIIGTPMYMAPEQLLPNWGEVTARTDVYSIGVVLYELIEHRTPRHGKSYAEIMSSILHERQANRMPWTKQASPALKRIIEKCLEVDPVDRYPNVRALGDDLRKLFEGRSTGIARTSSVRALKKWARHPRRPIEICFLIIPLNLILGAWMLFSAALILSPLYQGDHRMGDFMQCLAIAIVYDFGITLLCILRVFGHLWATPVALAMTLFVTVTVPLLAIFHWVPSFEGLYANAPLLSIANHAQILLIGIGQSIALAISIFADWANARRRLP